MPSGILKQETKDNKKECMSVWKKNLFESRVFNGQTIARRIKTNAVELLNTQLIFIYYKSFQDQFFLGPILSFPFLHQKMKTMKKKNKEQICSSDIIELDTSN